MRKPYFQKTSTSPHIASHTRYLIIIICVAALITFDDENNNIREFHVDEAALHMCATSPRWLKVHTPGYIRLFYYTPTIKQFNVIIVRFPDVGGGSLAHFFIIISVYLAYMLSHISRSTRALHLFINTWTNVYRSLTLVKICHGIVPHSFRRYTMISTDKLFVLFYNNNSLQ